ncbi:class I SAM-dependent RNA methyltransferase [Limobrevibacterium gyesilva]|uniref:Class I SAM-dependent RNA methyltransferase n=1 Tax=Limobrevibacterium gyesilva TaxID=2991712 RepID=A0AA41YQ07_9PROT|nr:class I SAM-dependent RNA methyltransferase [Limobrevibacterium gyesilva]
MHAQPTARRGEGWAGTADILAPSLERAAPACPHFVACGGCALQHWQDGAYSAWKAGLLEAALRRAGYADIAMAAPARTPARARRRMDLAIRRHGSVLSVGLHAGRSADVIDLRDCVVLHPLLFALVDPLRQVLRGLSALQREGSAVANLLESGADLLLRTDADLTAADRTRLAEFARTHGLPRISWARRNAAPETACLLRPAVVNFSGTPVSPPPGAFLQASREGEDAIVAATLAGLPDKLGAKARIAELYAGCGTLTFALAQRARVAAFEGDAPAARALQAGVNAAALAGRIDVQHRDLARQPLPAKELAGFAAVVLDPPHAGAVGQIGQIAASGVKRVIYVSCNPAALARDATLLRQAGYRLLSVAPVDQFLWSARLESVTVFAR